MAGRACRVAVAVVLAAAVSACSTLSERRDDVRSAVNGWERALDERAYERACAALAPGTVEELEQSADSPCAKALGEEQLKPGGAVRLVDVYGNQAWAVLTADTVFLSRFTEGWKVVAAGCEPRPQQPYQCRIKGG
jgi:hypothetical protein